MAQLRQDYEQFTQRGAEVLVISPEGADDVAKFWEAERLPFPGMADADHVVADAYGQKVSLLRMGRLPSLMVIDREGQIRYAHQGVGMHDIPSNREVLAVLDGLNAEAAPVPENGKAG
jgi:peroxiredoxin Q/BCP